METTIAAISTAMSASGIGIIRISGENAMDVISRIYRSKGGKKKIKEVPTHTIHYGYIYDGEELIDEVLVMIMHAPRTFTGEDTVEIDCHGGVYAMQRVLDTVLKNGAEIAEPGEFTKRAFLNGRMDLSQAEAVMDVIQAKNEYALRSSMDQLRGSVQKAIRDIREKLIYHIAYIESALDDPEHINLDGYPQELLGVVDNEQKEVKRLLKTSSDGKTRLGRLRWQWRSDRRCALSVRLKNDKVLSLVTAFLLPGNTGVVLCGRPDEMLRLRQIQNAFHEGIKFRFG